MPPEAFIHSGAVFGPAAFGVGPAEEGEGRFHELGRQAPASGHFAAEPYILECESEGETGRVVGRGHPRPAHVHLKTARARVREQRQQVGGGEARRFSEPQAFGKHGEVGHADEVADEFDRAGRVYRAHEVGNSDKREERGHALDGLRIAADEQRLLGLFGVRGRFAERALDVGHAVLRGGVGKGVRRGGIDGAQLDVDGAGPQEGVDAVRAERGLGDVFRQGQTGEHHVADGEVREGGGPAARGSRREHGVDFVRSAVVDQNGLACPDEIAGKRPSHRSCADKAECHERSSCMRAARRPVSHSDKQTPCRKTRRNNGTGINYA